MTQVENLEYQHEAPVTTGAASVAVLTAKNREYLGIANRSIVAAEVVWLNCAGAPAVVGVGIPIGPGGFWEPHTPPVGAIAAIAESGTPILVPTWG